MHEAKMAWAPCEREDSVPAMNHHPRGFRAWTT
jgi:hypothetical protein